MATKNIRVVSYLPPSYHEKLCEYIQEQELTESAAIVKIIKHFFEETTVKADSEKDEEIASLKADIAQIMQRLAVIEEAIASLKSRSSAQYRNFMISYSSPSLQPLKSDEFSIRRGKGWEGRSLPQT